MVDTKNEPAGQGLPDGWSKEYRPRKVKAGARARRDLYYIDPTKNYEFRSLKDVYRHLESRGASNSAVTSNKRKIEELRNSENQSHQAEGPSDNNNIQMDTAHESNPKSRGNSGNMPSSKHEGASKGRRTELELQKARVRNQSPKHESTGREEADMEPKPKEKRQRTKPGKQISPPVRASPRLTALKVNQELELSQEASNVRRDSPVSSTRTDIADQLKPTKQVENPKSKTIPSSLPQKKDTASASEHAGGKYPPAMLGTSAACSTTDARYQNSPAALHAPPPQQAGLFGAADAMPGSSLSSLLQSIWSDPCLEFAFKTLTGDIPVPDNNTLPGANYFHPPPQEVPKLDPCLEFAFKTLAGDIPVLDSNLSYLLPPQNLNKGAVPSCSSSTYDGTRMNHPQQVDRGRMPMPRPSDKFYGSGWFPPQ